jgi:predicted Holliday junction resolvase-like endonuclease
MKVVSSLLSGVVLCAALTPMTSIAAPRQVNKRLENQQDRINQGIKSGELTRKEAGNLEAKEARIKNNERFDRKKDNGKLTPAQRASLNKQLNRASRDIYKDKHNNRTQK